jgi:hypothetical protein
VRASLALHGPPGEVRAGRPVPVRASLRNDGPGELWIVGVVDGSESGTRYPHWLPSIVREGRAVAGPPQAEDPLVGPLRREDFHRLGAGDELEPGRLATFATYAPDEPGAYVYSLLLSTESARVEDWFGVFNQDPAVAELVARVPRLTLRADLTVTVAVAE